MKEYELIADSVEHILNAPKPRAPKWYGSLAPTLVLPPIAPFQDCFLESGLDHIWAPSEWTPDILPQINVAVLIDRCDLQPDTYVLRWVSTASKMQRRMARRCAPYMVTQFTANLIGGAWHDINVGIYSWLGGRWRDAMGGMVGGASGGAVGLIGRQEDADAEHTHIQLLYGAGLLMRYCYSVSLTDDPKNLSARLFAYPDTLRFLLRTRDIGNAARRKALVHLVRRHARRRRREYAVRQHLRGEHRCQWAGMDVGVLPSQYDAETASGAVTERLRADGLLRWVAA